MTDSTTSAIVPMGTWHRDQNFAADLARFDFVYAEDWRNDRVNV